MFDAVTYIVYLSLLFGVLVLLVSKRILFQENSDLHFDGFAISENRIGISAFLSLLLISFIVGFRYNVGVDWEGYKDAFEFFKRTTNVTYSDQRFEWGYYIINKIIASSGGHYSFMFFTVAFISWFFIFKSINSTLLPYVVFFIFTSGIFFWSMNGVRQFVAFSIFLYSIQFIVSRNFKIYIPLIILASLFHKSALLMAIFYFFPFDKMYNRGLWLILFIISAFVGNISYFIDGVESMAFFLIQKVSVLSSYNYYLENDLFVSNDLHVGLGFFFSQIVTLVELFFSKEIIRKHPHLKTYFVLYFIGVVLFNLFYSVQLIGRAIVYLRSLRIIIISIVSYHCLLDQRYRAVGIVLIMLFFGLFLHEIYFSANLCSPYRLTSF